MLCHAVYTANKTTPPRSILNQPLASPSLWRPKNESSQTQSTPSKHGAFEIKFVVEESLVESLIPRVAARMQWDPHADPKTGGYSVEGIYFETDQRDVYRRSPGYSRKKYRIRRYSEGLVVFLERKSKRNGIVSKRRLQLESAELTKVLKEAYVISDRMPNAENQDRSSGQTETDWFYKRLDRLKLRPTLCIMYDRIAFLQMENSGPIRLTVDRSIGCCSLNQLHFPFKADYQRILDGKCVIELKFRDTMPNKFRQIIEEYKLISQPVSKFRKAMVVTGLAAMTDHLPSEGTV